MFKHLLPAITTAEHCHSKSCDSTALPAFIIPKINTNQRCVNRHSPVFSTNAVCSPHGAINHQDTPARPRDAVCHPRPVYHPAHPTTRTPCTITTHSSEIISSHHLALISSYLHLTKPIADNTCQQ